MFWNRKKKSVVDENIKEELMKELSWADLEKVVGGASGDVRKDVSEKVIRKAFDAGCLNDVDGWE